MITENEGATTTPGDLPLETEGQATAAVDKYEELNSKVDLMLDNFARMQASLSSSNVPAPQSTMDDSEEDDDEPITGAKVKKIVRGAIGSAMSETQVQNTKRMWDDKASSEFPINDAKFQKELRATWSELVESGLSPSSPKALYTAAKMTALKFSKPETKKTTQRMDTSEAPNASTPVTRPSGKIDMVSENDTRVKFYSMRGKKTPDQLLRLRERLAKEDARKDRR